MHVTQAEAEETHARLARECLLPLDHPALRDWRLVKALGHGAFSTVLISLLAAPQTRLLSCPPFTFRRVQLS